MINSVPDLSKYERDKSFIEAVEKAWESEIYGLSVLQPIRKPSEGEPILIPNVLSQQIESYKTEHLYGGGFFNIENVCNIENGEPVFYDIFVLIESIDSYQSLQNFRKMYNIPTTTDELLMHTANSPRESLISREENETGMRSPRATESQLSLKDI